MEIIYLYAITPLRYINWVLRFTEELKINVESVYIDQNSFSFVYHSFGVSFYEMLSVPQFFSALLYLGDSFSLLISKYYPNFIKTYYF